MAHDNFKVIIVGAGPVGLTAAHALYLAGIDFVVLERRDKVVIDVGASLVLGPPSLRVMHQFGLLETLLDIGGELRRNKCFTMEGYEFKNSTGFQYLKQDHGIAPMAFHRAELIETLYKSLCIKAEGSVLTGKKVMDIASDNDGVKVTCADGTAYEGSMVLGADGVHSETRRTMRKLALLSNPKTEWDPEVPYTSAYRCMWCSFPRTSESGEGFETHHTDRSAMYLTGHDRGWIFLYEKLPQPTKEQTFYTEKDVEAYAARFADFPVNETLKVKDVFPMRLTSGMANLEEGLVENWSWGRIVLVGDACHKFTPNLGLGFNNGIQDVVALCNGLRETLNTTSTGQPSIAALTKVFQDYHSMRYEALQGDASRSANVTRMHAWASMFHFVMARYIMVPRFVEYFFLKYISFSAIRHGLVLDYVSSKEPFQGLISWIHQMKSPLGGVLHESKLQPVHKTRID
ncbi:hypothetical protein O988_09889 [Pseudogymnoascus sp. VKM F-3808]|nr:hypothetical protein O988_09889 [Pseudogymnoascus sp. VKM F-3808]